MSLGASYSDLKKKYQALADQKLKFENEVREMRALQIAYTEKGGTELFNKKNLQETKVDAILDYK